MTKDIGNVDEKAEITFEYKLKKVADLIRMSDFDITLIEALPFQAQIYFTKMDGSKCVRVITR